MVRSGGRGMKIWGGLYLNLLAIPRNKTDSVVSGWAEEQPEGERGS
jgi:hypothetical protein